MPTKPIPPAKIKTPESGVQKACLDLLDAEKIWHRRWNTGAVKMGMNPNQKARFFRFGKKGDADILAAPCTAIKIGGDWVRQKPEFLWIECKSSSGQQTEEQIVFECEVKEQGHHYLLVDDVDQLRNWLKKHGV